MNYNKKKKKKKTKAKMIESNTIECFLKKLQNGQGKKNYNSFNALSKATSP